MPTIHIRVLNTLVSKSLEPSSHKSYSHKKYKKYNSVKPNDFYAKKKNVSKKYDTQRSDKVKCFNCGKPRHFSKDCKQKPSKLKNKFNILNIDDKEQEELFRIKFKFKTQNYKKNIWTSLRKI